MENSDFPLHHDNLFTQRKLRYLRHSSIIRIVSEYMSCMCDVFCGFLRLVRIILNLQLKLQTYVLNSFIKFINSSTNRVPQTPKYRNCLNFPPTLPLGTRYPFAPPECPWWHRKWLVKHRWCRWLPRCGRRPALRSRPWGMRRFKMPKYHGQKWQNNLAMFQTKCAKQKDKPFLGFVSRRVSNLIRISELLKFW